jgi:putative salt-induced outer membrane protein YdiY
VPKRLFLPLTLAATLVWAGPAPAATTIELTNGDTLTGKTIEQTENQVVLSHPTLGEVTIDREQIASIERTEQQSADAEDESPEGDSGEAQSTEAADASGESQAAKPKDAEQDEPAGPWETSLLPEWDKSISLGFSGSEGNSQNQSFNAQFQMKRNTEQVRTNFNNQYFYATSSGTTTQNEFSSQLTHDWLKPGSSWFIFTQLGYEYDQFESWRHRVSGYVGPGYTFIDNADFELVGRVGAGGNYEFGNVNAFTPEALVGGEVVRWNITERQTFTGQVTIYPDLEELGEYRAVAKAEWQVKIDRAKGLSLKLGIEDEYESVTQGDSEHNDLKYYGSLDYAF